MMTGWSSTGLKLQRCRFRPVAKKGTSGSRETWIERGHSARVPTNRSFRSAKASPTAPPRSSPGKRSKSDLCREKMAAVIDGADEIS